MTIELASPAVAVAWAQVEAWSNGWATARKSLVPDVHVRRRRRRPVVKATDLTGADDYRHGLKEFAEAVLTGSLSVNLEVPTTPNEVENNGG